MRAVDPTRSRVVLVGAPLYDDPLMLDIPEVARNLADLALVFTEPTIGGFSSEHCTIVEPDATVDRVGDLLNEAADQAEDLLLFYFAGHGLIGPRGELYLGLRRTRFQNPAYSALRFETVRDTFLESPARAVNRVVIIDSCFSGRAIGPTLAGAVDTLADELEISGTYTLTSAPPNSVALVREGEVHTAFTGRLLRLLRGGSPLSGDLLSLGDIYRHLHARLQADGLPLPQQRGTATADLLGLVRNRHPAAESAASAAQKASPLATLPDGMRVALESPYPRLQNAAIDELSGWLTGSDRRRVHAAQTALESIVEQDAPLAAAAQAALQRSARPPSPALRARATLDEAERIAATLSDLDLRESVLVEIAHALVEIDHDHAERIAATITDADRYASVLVGIAKARVATDPDHAERLLDDAQRAAATMTDGHRKALVLVEVAKVMATTDPDRAARTATTLIAHGRWGRGMNISTSTESDLEEAEIHLNQSLLSAIATALAVSAPDHAERIAATIISSGHIGQSVLVEIVHALAATDPDRAERIARMNTITTTSWKVAMLLEIAKVWDKTPALVEIAKAVAADDPDRAERIAATLRAGWAVAAVAQVLAASDPDRAERIIAASKQEYSTTTVLVQIVKVVAATDPDKAVRIAETVTDAGLKAAALVHIAKVTTDPKRSARLLEAAERVAATVTVGYPRARALLQIAVTLAATDPERAVRIAATSNDQSPAAHASAAIAGALAVVDAGRAERFAATLTDEPERVRALVGIARRLTAVDPGRAARLVDEAERCAEGISVAYESAAARRVIAELLAVTAPDRAARIAASLADRSDRLELQVEIVRRLAAADPDRAEHIVDGLTDADGKAVALTVVAGELAATEPDRASRLLVAAECAAATTTDEHQKALALVAITRATGQRSMQPRPVRPPSGRRSRSDGSIFAVAPLGRHRWAVTWSTRANDHHHCSSAAAAAPRTCSSPPGTPVAAARQTIMPHRSATTPSLSAQRPGQHLRPCLTRADGVFGKGKGKARRSSTANQHAAAAPSTCAPQVRARGRWAR